MVIDKATGKGCAWGIASKTITRRLIAEGITDKQFARQPTRNRYRLLGAEKRKDGQVYVTRWRSNGLADEILWTPSFIEAGIWERGASRFDSIERLDRNVEKYLLSEMEPILQPSTLCHSQPIPSSPSYFSDPINIFFKEARFLPFLKISVNTAATPIFPWDRFPLAPRPQNIEDAIQSLPGGQSGPSLSGGF